jgi:hypothetical protein
MFDRIMSAVLLLGACALALFLFQRQYAAPFCSADSVTSQAVSQISASVGSASLDVANVRTIHGGLFSRIRHCQMDVAPIVDLQRLRAAHWTRVVYSDARAPKGDAVTVTAHVDGPAELSFSGG